MRSSNGNAAPSVERSCATLNAGHRKLRPVSTRLLPLVLLLVGCVTPPAPPRPALPPPVVAADDEPRRVARAFFDAAAARDGEAMLLLLSARWRGQLSPAKLLGDLDAGGLLATDRLARARVALLAPGTVTRDAALFPLDEAHALRLVREPDGWRLDELP